MTATRSAAEIAATLTKAQRDSIYPGPGNPEYARGPTGSMHALLKMGVVKQVAHWTTQGKRGATLTPLGLEVRAILASTEHGNADG